MEFLGTRCIRPQQLLTYQTLQIIYTSSLSGTITNAQLAGSIANSNWQFNYHISDGSNSTGIGRNDNFFWHSGEVDVESSGTVTIGLQMM